MGRITRQDIVMPSVYIANIVMQTGNTSCLVLVRVRREHAVVIYKSSSREHIIKVNISIAPRASCQTIVPVLELILASLFMFILALLVEFMALASVAWIAISGVVIGSFPKLSLVIVAGPFLYNSLIILLCHIPPFPLRPYLGKPTL
jgi:hypothetical protein